MEKFDNEVPAQELDFKKENPKEGVVSYAFDHVIVGIDETGKNYKELPEILFATFGSEDEKPSPNKPSVRRDNVSIDYVARCIARVAEDSGIHDFWLYPFGDDNPENPERRSVARLKLFQKFGNITPAPGGFGHILHID